MARAFLLQAVMGGVVVQQTLLRGILQLPVILQHYDPLSIQFLVLGPTLLQVGPFLTQ